MPTWGAHFIAASTNRRAAMAFGIRAENVFECWAWVGGRYSMWSSTGLPIALSIGFVGFIELLEGAHAMDRHFIEAPFAQNMPVLMALIGIWYITFIGAETQGLLELVRGHFSEGHTQNDGPSRNPGASA